MKKLLFFAVVMLVGFSAKAQDLKNSKWLLNGQKIAEASQFTQDTQGDFYRVLTYQSMYDRPLSYFGINYRSAPASFVLNDGQIVSDNLNRILLTTGIRLGKRAFVGIIADAIENGRLDDSKQSLFKTNISQGLVYGGLKFGGLQATAAWHSRSSQSGTNLRGELISETARNDNLREVESKSTDRLIYSVYAKPGIFVSVSKHIQNPYGAEYSDITASDQTDIAVILQSPKRYLPKWAGLPFLQLERYTNVQILDDQDAPKETIFGTLGSDDIRAFSMLKGLGVRMAVQYKLRPTPALQHIEASGKWRVNDYIEVGARSFLFNNTGSPSLASDEYISIGWKNTARWAFTHSYNSPDRSTFLPVSGVHVYGFQVVYGISDIIKPLIPMIRSINETGDSD